MGAVDYGGCRRIGDLDAMLIDRRAVRPGQYIYDVGAYLCL
jgi:hypothetical protein